jgi:hypothetical protein
LRLPIFANHLSKRMVINLKTETQPPTTDSDNDESVFGANSHPKPFDRVPPEILVDIFICVQSLSELSEPSEISVPIPEALVCKSWFQLAHSSPPLWTRLAVSLDRRSLLQRYEAICQQYITLSGSLPLAVYLRATAGTDFEMLGAILQLLATVSYRWGSLTVVAHYMRDGWDFRSNERPFPPLFSFSLQPQILTALREVSFSNMPPMEVLHGLKPRSLRPSGPNGHHWST